MATSGRWVNLTKKVHLGSGQVRGSAPGEMSLWDAAASHDLRASSLALGELGFSDGKKEDYLKILDIRIVSTPNAGLIDDEMLKVEIKVPAGTEIVYEGRR